MSGREHTAALEIPVDLHDAMIAHCRAEAPIEACGLLGGIAPRVSSWHPFRNAKVSPTRYEADPNDVVRAVVALRGEQAAILALYHSHPRWPAIPSRTDLELNYYGDVPRIIVSLQQEPPEVRVWRFFANAYQELPWRLVAPIGLRTVPDRSTGE